MVKKILGKTSSEKRGEKRGERGDVPLNLSGDMSRDPLYIYILSHDRTINYTPYKLT